MKIEVGKTYRVVVDYKNRGGYKKDDLLEITYIDKSEEYNRVDFLYNGKKSDFDSLEWIESMALEEVNNEQVIGSGIMKIEVGKMYDSKEVIGGQVKVIERIVAGRTVEGEELVKILDTSGREFNITTEYFLNNYKVQEEKEITSSKPAHYDTAIDTIAFAKANFSREQVEGFMRINAVKYIQRYPAKNGVDDVRKAVVYLNMLIEHLEEEEK